MKRIMFLLPFLFFLYACPLVDPIETEYSPIFMDRTTLEASVQFSVPKELEQTGKIYYKDNKIYISERYKGVHVINNTNPTNPQNIEFISAAGCVDMAIKDNILYLDNAVDLVAVDLSTKKIVKRVKNVFPEPFPPDLDFMPSEFARTNRTDTDKIIVGWKLIE